VIPARALDIRYTDYSIYRRAPTSYISLDYPGNGSNYSPIRGSRSATRASNSRTARIDQFRPSLRAAFAAVFFFSFFFYSEEKGEAFPSSPSSPSLHSAFPRGEKLQETRRRRITRPHVRCTQRTLAHFRRALLRGIVYDRPVILAVIAAVLRRRSPFNIAG